jgi:hypothetical protein
MHRLTTLCYIYKDFFTRLTTRRRTFRSWHHNKGGPTQHTGAPNAITTWLSTSGHQLLYFELQLAVAERLRFHFLYTGAIR